MSGSVHFHLLCCLIFVCRLGRIRSLEEALRIEKQTSAELQKTIADLKSQNQQLIEWKTETHARLEEEKKLLERKVSALSALF